MFFSRAYASVAGLSYKDRGNVAGFDFEIGAFTKDDNPHTLDLSGILPEGVTRFKIRLELAGSNTGRWFKIRENGNADWINCAFVTQQTAGLGVGHEYDVICDSNRLVEYAAVSSGITVLSLIIKGWWI